MSVICRNEIQGMPDWALNNVRILDIIEFDSTSSGRLQHASKSLLRTCLLLKCVESLLKSTLVLNNRVIMVALFKGASERRFRATEKICPPMFALETSLFLHEKSLHVFSFCFVVVVSESTEIEIIALVPDVLHHLDTTDKNLVCKYVILLGVVDSPGVT